MGDGGVEVLEIRRDTEVMARDYRAEAPRAPESLGIVERSAEQLAEL